MGVGRLGEGGHYFLLIKFFKILYKKMFKIFYMVPLGSYVTFSPNLSKFSGWRKYRGWRFWKTFQKFPPPFMRRLQNMSSGDDENFDKSELIYGEGSVIYMRIGSKLLSENITKQLFFFFASWRRLSYPSLLILWTSSVCYWKTH